MKPFKMYSRKITFENENFSENFDDYNVSSRKEVFFKMMLIVI